MTLTASQTLIRLIPTTAQLSKPYYSYFKNEEPETQKSCFSPTC